MITVDASCGELQFETREDSVTDEIVLREMFNENVYHVHNNMIIDSGVVIDIGANIGAFTIDMLVRATENNKPIKVIAVEPEPHNRKLLEKNIELNKHLFPGCEVVICDKAVGGKSGTVTISDEHGGARVGKSGATVEMITLKELFNMYDIKKVDFMKVDIEGSEVDAILSLNLTQLDSIRRMAIEYDEHNGIDLFVDLIKVISRKCSFYTLGVPSRGCYLYTERHI